MLSKAVNKAFNFPENNQIIFLILIYPAVKKYSEKHTDHSNNCDWTIPKCTISLKDELYKKGEFESKFKNLQNKRYKLSMPARSSATIPSTEAILSNRSFDSKL